MCDLCLLSWDDVMVLFDCYDCDGIVDMLFGWGVKLVVFKMGVEGCYVVMFDVCMLVLCYMVNVIDVIGVGDCFGGVFVVWIVVGDLLVEVVWYVNVVVVILMMGYSVVVLILWVEVVWVVLG